mmetsp:Transcript_20549/g.58718  ORF Transcript_20549/g.58718 Transcript_20549/m.58718 type:complete len:399 (+) Transcript_20549:422-1618(+)
MSGGYLGRPGHLPRVEFNPDPIHVGWAVIHLDGAGRLTTRHFRSRHRGSERAKKQAMAFCEEIRTTQGETPEPASSHQTTGVVYDEDKKCWRAVWRCGGYLRVLEVPVSQEGGSDTAKEQAEAFVRERQEAWENTIKALPVSRNPIHHTGANPPALISPSSYSLPPVPLFYDPTRPTTQSRSRRQSLTSRATSSSTSRKAAKPIRRTTLSPFKRAPASHGSVPEGVSYDQGRRAWVVHGMGAHKAFSEGTHGSIEAKELADEFWRQLMTMPVKAKGASAHRSKASLSVGDSERALEDAGRMMDELRQQVKARESVGQLCDGLGFRRREATTEEMGGTFEGVRLEWKWKTTSDGFTTYCLEVRHASTLGPLKTFTITYRAAHAPSPRRAHERLMDRFCV